MKVNAINLKLLAAEKGLNVQELADTSGVSFATVCKARACREVSERTIVKLAKALDIEARELMDPEGGE